MTRGSVILFCMLALLGCGEGSGVPMADGGGASGGEGGGPNSGDMSLPNKLPWVVCGGYEEKEFVVGNVSYVLEVPVNCDEHIKPGDDVMGGLNQPAAPVAR